MLGAEDALAGGCELRPVTHGRTGQGGRVEAMAVLEQQRVAGVTRP